MEELLACHQWRVEVVAWLEGSPPPQDEVALYDLLLEAVDLVVSLGINDSWYGLVVPVVAWTLERHGLDVPRELEDTLYNLTCGRFTSWSEPSVRDRRAFAEAAALEALDRQLEELWPAPPGGEQA